MAGSISLNNYQDETELKHENHERGILKLVFFLVFLMLASRSVRHNFVSAGSAVASVFLKTTRPGNVHFLGRPAGENLRGVEICRFEIGGMDVCFGFDTQALVYDKGGGFNRSAHSAGPG